MPTVPISDYKVLSDAAVTLVPEPGTGETDEREFSAPLPADIELSTARQRAVLMFKAWTEGGNVNARVDVNANNQRNLSDYRSPVEQTIHEVINMNILRAADTNSFRFRVTSGDTGAKLYVSDVILWYQRDVEV